MHTSTSWLKFGSLSPAVTLKNRSRSPKPNQLFIMSQYYIHANLVEICLPVHEIWCTQALFVLNWQLSPAVTLKIRWGSPKLNQLFIMSQRYIHANLVKIHQPVQEIPCKQESVTPMPMPTPTGSSPKTICPPPVGDIIIEPSNEKRNIGVLRTDLFVCLCWGFTALSTAKVMLSRSVTH